MNSIEEDVTVEYGLTSIPEEFGSGLVSDSKLTHLTLRRR